MSPLVRDSLIDAGLRAFRWLIAGLVATLPLWFLSLVLGPDLLGVRVRSHFPLVFAMPDLLMPEYALAAVAMVAFYARSPFEQHFAGGPASNRRVFFYTVWALIFACFVIVLASYISYTIQLNAVEADVSDEVLREAKTAVSASFTAILLLTLMSELIIAFRRRG